MSLDDLLPAETTSPEATMALGEQLAGALQPGDVLALYGDLGAGKTHLVKGIVRGLGGQPEDVTSPTFTLIQEYATDPPLYHIDVYRIEQLPELERMGFGAYLHGDGLSYTEPMFHWNITANPKARFSVGFEHPFITERLIKLFKTGDETERLAIQKEMANWLFDNAQMSSIWVADIAWPLGPKLEGAWEDHSAGRDSRNLSGVEYARPSK
ncbi:MAG: tRNA (adenosine(37)-N6)-threonylcarbamoyltransferase complex ATPase subunit type 1 TsaE [Bacteroidetes bacterium]|nr:tRNA (adenosine(37)-N6)-threonylcarbamoyltransferase complex ATPase subunit type 1 TsaE [Bacteroidota bacterium]